LFLACGGVARYKILLKEIVAKEFEAMDSKGGRRRVLARIAALGDEARPADAERLPEHVDHYRIYLGTHRIIYHIDDRKRWVTVFRIAHCGRQNCPG
jgi:mRNA interferase RelE/StbE